MEEAEDVAEEDYGNKEEEKMKVALIVGHWIIDSENTHSTRQDQGVLTD